MTSELLAENDDQIGGDTAISYVEKGYVGACEIKTDNGFSIAVLPTLEEAISVARYAIKPDGGYGSVEIHSSSLAITHSNFMNWLG